MKNLLKITILFATLNLSAQITGNPSKFNYGIAVPNATEVTTADSIPVLDGNLKMNTWISAANLLDGLASGSGTVNYLAKFTATGTVGDSQVFDNGTNVGIGTTTPDAKLEIVNTDPTLVHFKISSSDATSGDVFKIDNNGLGTLTTQTTGIALTLNTEGATLLELNALNNPRITFNSGGTYKAEIMAADSSNLLRLNSILGGIVFRANGVDAMRLHTDKSLTVGNGGIASHPLHVFGGQALTSGDVDLARFQIGDFNHNLGIGSIYINNYLNRGLKISGGINPSDEVEAELGLQLTSSASSYVPILQLKETGDVIALGNVGIGITTPAASAKLQVESTTQGFLPPRMTAAQKNAITSPAEGLMIYQTDGTKGWYGYNGTTWVQL